MVSLAEETSKPSGLYGAKLILGFGTFPVGVAVYSGLGGSSMDGGFPLSQPDKAKLENTAPTRSSVIVTANIVVFLRFMDKPP